MPGLSHRARVWRGEIRKTTGGLTKADLTKNKAGKIVSKRKSLAAVKANNLGNWIRAKGDPFKGKPAAFPTKGKKSDAVDLTKETVFKAPKKKKLDSKKTVNILKKAKAIARKTARAERPKQKAVPKAKKEDFIDLTNLKEPSLADLLGELSD